MLNNLNAKLGILLLCELGESTRKAVSPDICNEFQPYKWADAAGIGSLTMIENEIMNEIDDAFWDKQ